MPGETATRRVMVSRPAGLHARPCVAIASTVRRFQSKVRISCGAQEADAGDVLQLLSLGAGQGSELVLTAMGADAEEVLDALVALFANDFGLSPQPGAPLQHP